MEKVKLYKLIKKLRENKIKIENILNKNNDFDLLIGPEIKNLGDLIFEMEIKLENI